MTSSTERAQKLRVLHLVLVLRSTNSQYNEHSLPVMHERSIALCTFFAPKLVPPEQIKVFAGDGSVRGFFRALRAALQSEQFDVVHAHSPHTGFLLVMAMPFSLGGESIRRRSAYTVHDSFYDYRIRHKLLMLPVFAFFRNLVFCSNAAHESFPRSLKRLIGSRGRVVQNGVDISRIDRVIASLARKQSGPFTVVSVGRLESVKDPQTLLAAFAAVGGSDSRLVFVGDGELRIELEKAIASAGLGERVTLAGVVERDEVFEHFMAADVFMSTSRGEGLPLAVMEAMACSVPVILSDIPPHREFGADSGIVPLVAPGNVTGFSDELARVRDMTQSERAEVGGLGRELVASRFGLEQMSIGYESLYDEIAGERFGSL